MNRRKLFGILSAGAVAPAATANIQGLDRQKAISLDAPRYPDVPYRFVKKAIYSGWDYHTIEQMIRMQRYLNIIKKYCNKHDIPFGSCIVDPVGGSVSKESLNSGGFCSYIKIDDLTTDDLSCVNVSDQDIADFMLSDPCGLIDIEWGLVPA